MSRRIRAITHSTPVSVALMLTVAGALYWAGRLSERVAAHDSTLREHARLIESASKTLAAVEARLEERK